MNKIKRNRLKNKEKIKKLQQEVRQLRANPVTDTVFVEDKSATDLAKRLKLEIEGLHRFISRADLSVDVLTRSFNCEGPILIPQLSNGALTSQALETLRFRKYEQQGYRAEPLYMIGITPSDDPSQERQISFHLSRDLIRDFPVDRIIHKYLAKLLEARKYDLLK